MNDMIKAAFIIGIAIVAATGLWIYFSPYQTCVRSGGGGLTVDWREDNHVVLGGPVARSFSGVLDTSLFHNGLSHD